MAWSTKAFALTAVVILLAALFFIIPQDDDEDKGDYNPTTELGSEYIIVAQIPATEEERIVTVGLSNLAVRGAVDDPHYNPLYFVPADGLDDHSLWTLEMLDLDVPVYVFGHDGLENTIAGQVEDLGLNVTAFEYSKDSLMDFKGFDAPMTAASYEEALWMAPLSRLNNQIIVPGKQTYGSQEDVWLSLWGSGLDADYVVVANPEDYKDMYTEFGGVNSSYHIKHLALTSAALAMYRMGYVITEPEPLTLENVPTEYENLIPPDDPGLNLWQMGLLNLFRNMSAEYGPINSIALVGSAEAVPQFECPDWSNSEPDYSSSDSVYGFLDDDNSDMDAGVGRMVNYNIQGLSNQLVRTFRYYDLADTVTVDFSNGETRTENWRSHGIAANGFEVADMRGQNTPGLFASRDYDDESYTFDYIGTPGGSVEGDLVVGIPGDMDVEATAQLGGHLVYRGHGSWHGTLYTWRYYDPITTEYYGTEMIEGDAARDMFVPPQVTLLFSCENSKIHGLSYGGDPIDMDRVFATNWMYAGAVGLIAATEVSYSNIGQDGWALVGEVSNDHNWDLNNLWFASTAKYTLDEEYPMGEVLRLSENRYLDKHPGVDPFTIPSGDDGAHWKEIVMYGLVGDPAFEYHVTSEGENNYMPWD